MALRMLIVEDDSDANDMLAELLRRRGYETTQTFTGKKALESAHEHPPDLMLLDLMLPDMDGFEVCETLRTHRETNLIPVVMVTALSQCEHRVHGFRVGANSYLVKPYTKEQLYEAIEHSLSWRMVMKEGKVEGEIAFEISSETQHLLEVNDLLTSLLVLSPLKERAADQLRRALLEMGQNAIEWGNNHQVEKVVRITYQLHPDRIELHIRDEGGGFDPEQVPHASDGEDPVSHFPIREVLGLRDGGFGILIAKGLVDDMSYNEAGNEVTLVKMFNSQG